jgi:hypothetical protein
MTRNTNSYCAGEDIKSSIRPSKPDTGETQSLRDHADKMEALEALQIDYDAYKLEVARCAAYVGDCTNCHSEHDQRLSRHDAFFRDSNERFEQLVEHIINFNQAGK